MDIQIGMFDVENAFLRHADKSECLRRLKVFVGLLEGIEFARTTEGFTLKNITSFELVSNGDGLADSNIYDHIHLPSLRELIIRKVPVTNSVSRFVVWNGGHLRVLDVSLMKVDTDLGFFIGGCPNLEDISFPFGNILPLMFTHDSIHTVRVDEVYQNAPMVGPDRASDRICTVLLMFTLNERRMFPKLRTVQFLDFHGMELYDLSIGLGSYVKLRAVLDKCKEMKIAVYDQNMCTING